MSILLSTGGSASRGEGLHRGGSASRGSASGGNGWADPLPSDTTRYGQRADGTHSTGMHSGFNLLQVKCDAVPGYVCMMGPTLAYTEHQTG